MISWALPSSPDGDTPAEDVVEAEDRVQDRRLAGAVGPDQAQGLLATDPQVDPVQYLHLAVSGVKIVDAHEGLVTRQFVELFDGVFFRNRGSLPGDFIDGNDGVDAAFAMSR